MQYAFRQNSDFDKYKALEMIESLKNAALDVRDKKADYFSTVHSKLLERITKPTEQFKSYVLSLLGDRDYEKVVEAVSKVDKAFTQETPVAPPIPPSSMVSYDSGHPAPSHYGFSSPMYSPLRQSGVTNLSSTFSRPAPYFPPHCYHYNPRPHYTGRGSWGGRLTLCSYCERYGHTFSNCHRREFDENRPAKQEGKHNTGR